MSCATSAVTYTSVYTDSELGRAFWGADDEEVSERGIPRVIVLGYDGLPLQPVALPLLDYIPGTENPQTPLVPQDEDEHEFLAEEQPLPGHITESDPEEDPEIQRSTRKMMRHKRMVRIDYPMDVEMKEMMGRQCHLGMTPMIRMGYDRTRGGGEESTYFRDPAIVVTCDEPVFPLREQSLLYHHPHIDITPLRKRLYLSTIGSRYEIEESSTARPTRDFRDTWVDPAEAVPKVAPMTVGEVNTRVTELAELHEHDTQDLYALLEDAQDSTQTQLPLQSTLIQHIIGPDGRDSPSHQRYEARDERHAGRVVSTARAAERARQPAPDARVPDHQDASRDRARQQIIAPTTKGGPNTAVNNSNQNNMTPESIQAMIDQALLQNFTNGDGSHSSHEDNQRNVQTTCPCFYADFMKCQPLNFKGTKGVVGLTRWIEKMESVFNISGYAIENQIRTLGPEAYAMIWEVLKKKMTDKYCPHGEIKKLEIEPWNLKVKGNDVTAYTEHFQELTLICTKFVANETEKVDKYISGLPDNIYGNVKYARPKTLDETIKLANDLMDQKLRTYTERQSDNKRKADDSSKNNHGHQQQPFKRQNVAKKCHKCNKLGHFARDYRNTGNTNVANTQKGNGAAPKENGCFECGAPGHFKRDYHKLKNKDGGNGNAQGWVYEVGNAKKRGNASGNPDTNVVTGTFLLNNHYASILFDTGADRSFISTAFSPLINIAPTLLENCYDVELADEKLVGIDTIIRGCTLNFLDHPFNIDLMPVELGSFDVIIGMDWLRRCHAVIVCDEKLVQIPYGNETLTFCGNKSSNGRESRLTVISCSKVQEYMAKGYQVFLAQISAKKEEDKSEGKQIKDVPIVRDFPEVFSEDLPGLPPTRLVEFQIDLIPGAAPVARAPYRLAPYEMKELSEQLQELSDKGFIRHSSSP
ncbi:putative reverse transcriptase domain-containing protein [Tanacetum coccineum]